MYQRLVIYSIPIQLVLRGLFVSFGPFTGQMGWIFVPRYKTYFLYIITSDCNTSRFCGRPYQTFERKCILTFLFDGKACVPDKLLL